jgi:hypothetical protein
MERMKTRRKPYEVAVAKAFKAASALLTTALEAVDVGDLPSVVVDTMEMWPKLPAISAVYFLRSASGRDVELLAEQRRAGALVSPWDDDSPTVVYIGRATNLRNRFYNGGEFGVDHHRLKRALAFKDVSIHWLAVDKDHLAMAESVLLKIHLPDWNGYFH